MSGFYFSNGDATVRRQTSKFTYILLHSFKYFFKSLPLIQSHSLHLQSGSGFTLKSIFTDMLPPSLKRRHML